MRKHRFFISCEISIGEDLALTPDLLQHIKVLRLKDGETIYLFNNSIYEYTAILQGKYAKIEQLDSTNRESPVNINLGQVIGKNDKMDFVIQKATELGVNSISPLFSQYSISNKTNKLPHWQKIAIAASMQSWRNFVPNVDEPQNIHQWIISNNAQYKFIFIPGGNKLTTQIIINSVAILIGPEGGFSQEEIDLAIHHGFSPVAIGPRILRTETAGLAAIAIIQAAAGDM